MTTHTPAPAQEAVPSDDQILEVFAEFGQPNDERYTMTYNAPQIVAAVRALLSKLRAPVADERAAFEAKFPMPEQCAWTGKGYSATDYNAWNASKHASRWEGWQARAALASAPVPKPKRAPLDDWRVQAIADCLETEWDDMSPDLAESYARTIVGYMIEYEKESDRIEAQHAAEPVEPIVQAVRNLRASAPVAGEAQEHIEQMAVNRYRPVPDGKFNYKVVAGDGTRSLYTGTKDSCLRVAAKLTEAFLDGAFVAAAPQASEAVRDADALKVVQSLPRYSFGYKADEWGMGNYLTGLPRDNGPYLLRDEVIAALSAQPGAQKGGSDAE